MITASSVQRILSLLPDASRVCDTTCYGPIRYTAAGGVQVLMTQGGVIFPFSMEDYSIRHADQLYRSTLAGSAWSTPLETITRKNGGPWMSEPVYMNAHPEDFISAWTVGNVVNIGSEYLGIFCGCCADPNCGTEWGPVATPYGSRLSPFPYFNAFLFKSPNGIDQWEMITNPYGLDTGDRLLDARFMGLTPAPSDYNLPPAGPTGFKGLDKCSIGVLHPDGHWYGTADFWSSFGPKTLVWRIDQSAFTAVLASDSIKTGALPEIWNGSQWIVANDGIIPAELNTSDLFHGNAFDTPAGTPALAPPGSPGRYMIALLMSPTPETIQRVVGISFTDNFIHWKPKEAITEPMSFVIGDPQVYAEPDGSITLLFDATECPDTAYNGRGIYEAHIPPAEVPRVHAVVNS